MRFTSVQEHVHNDRNSFVEHGRLGDLNYDDSSTS